MGQTFMTYFVFLIAGVMYAMMDGWSWMPFVLVLFGLVLVERRMLLFRGIFSDVKDDPGEFHGEDSPEHPQHPHHLR